MLQSFKRNGSNGVGGPFTAREVAGALADLGWRLCHDPEADELAMFRKDGVEAEVWIDLSLENIYFGDRYWATIASTMVDRRVAGATRRREVERHRHALLQAVLRFRRRDADDNAT